MREAYQRIRAAGERPAWISLVPRRVLHFNITAHPTAEWTGQQLREAFPFDQNPRYLMRDRDGIFGDDFSGQSGIWKSSKCFRYPGRAGSGPMWNASSRRFVGSASII
jgi:hypothetical protein